MTNKLEFVSNYIRNMSVLLIISLYDIVFKAFNLSEHLVLKLSLKVIEKTRLLVLEV